jgi:antitoxin FitA
MCYRSLSLAGVVRVATLIVRNLDEDLVERLKARAKAAGLSAEAEHRRILESALRPQATMAEVIEGWRALGLDLQPGELETRDLVDQTVRFADFSE